MTRVQCMGNEWNAFVQSRFLPFFHHLLSSKKNWGELPAPSKRETGRQGSQISEVWLCCWQRAPLHYSPPCLDPWEYFGITTHYIHIYTLLSMVWSYSRGRAMRILHNDQCHFSHTYVYATLWLMLIFCFAVIIKTLNWFEQVWTSIKPFEHVWMS